MNRIRIDVPAVSEDEAVSLLIHHLQLAAALFEATPYDLDHLKAKISDKISSPTLDPALNFVEQLHNYYEDLDK